MKKTVFLLLLLLPFCYLIAQPPVPITLPISFTSIAQPVDDHNVIDDQDIGNKNVKNLKQVGNDNYIWVDITGNRNGYDHASKSLQTGVRNYADVHQPGNKNRFEIEQTNKTPTSSSVTDDRNKALIIQKGDRNEAIITQEIQNHVNAVDGKLVAKVYQGGDDNLSMQEQYGKRNRAWVVQQGTNGVAKQWQGESATSTKSFYNNAVILQRGKADQSRAYQYQKGFSNDASIIQRTDESVAKQVQFNNNNMPDGPDWDDNVARIKQQGDNSDNGNRAYQFQYHRTVYPIGNYATIRQKGSDNVAWQVQLGGKNVDVINQVGNDNVTRSLQIQANSDISAPTPASLSSLPFSFNVPTVIMW